MLSKDNIHLVLKDLSLEMKKEEGKESLSIFGSSSLIIQGISRSGRSTKDIDVVNKELDPKALYAAFNVADKWGLDITWLNSAGHIFKRNLPEGWEKRLVSLYKDDVLEVKSLSRRDLIKTKFMALVNRDNEFDKDDLFDLRPKPMELKQAYNYVLGLKKHDKDRIKSQYSAIIKELEKDKERGLG